jgi:hypothetical protein
MSNSRLIFVAGVMIVAAVIALTWPHVKECFFTQGQSCVCKGSARAFSSCRVSNSN